MPAPTVYLGGLTLPQLHGELLLAAVHVERTRVVYAPARAGYRCEECRASHPEKLKIEHAADCAVGMLAAVLRAIAHQDAAVASVDVPPTPSERSLQSRNSACEPGTAARETRPFLVAKPVWDPRLAPRVGAHGEPWHLDDEGNVLDAEGNEIVDGWAWQEPEPEKMQTARRVVGCVNFLAGFDIPEGATAVELEAAGGVQ